MKCKQARLFVILLLLLTLNSISNLALSSANVYAQSPVTCTEKFAASMVGYWSYDDPVEAMKPTYGALRGTIVGSLRLTAGVVGQALALSGAGYVSYGTTLDVPAWHSYTVSIWFLNDGRLAPVAGYGQKIIDKTTWFSDFFIGVPNPPNPTTPHSVVFMYDRDFKNIQTAGYDYIDGKWHHAVITKNGTHGELWVDGVFIGAKDDVNPTINDQPLLLGYSLAEDSYQRLYWGGYLDEFAVFNRALTAAEIGDLYTTSAAGQSYCTGELVPAVNTVADPGDGRCDGSECTLREALVLANSSPGFSEIRFQIPGPGPHVIYPQTPLPTITAPVKIDGYTQAGAFMGTTSEPADMDLVIQIEVNGSQLTPDLAPGLAPAQIGLHLQSPASQIQGLAIHSFDDAAILLDKDALDVMLNWNFIGTDASGQVAGRNGIGIQAGPYNFKPGRLDLQGNLIAGNTTGIWLDQTARATIIYNRIGLGLSGEPLGNEIGITGKATTSTDVVRNLIAYNTIAGVLQPQTGYLNLSVNEIIHNAVGVHCQGAGQCYMQGNTIAFNGDDGVLLQAGTDHLLLNNEISHNGRHGLQVANEARKVTATGNVITNNSGNGVTITGQQPALAVALMETNTFAGNGGLGIDLGNDGITANDPFDSDSGPNGLINFPDIPVAEPGVIELRFHGAPNTVHWFSFYANAACDPTGYGEGEIWIGRNAEQTDSRGNTGFVRSLSDPPAPVGYYITTIATDLAGRSSEFSTCTPVTTKINGRLQLLTMQARYNPNDRRATAGVYTIVATFRNQSTTRLRHLYAKSTKLEYNLPPQWPANLTVLNGEYLRAGGGYKVAVPGEVAPGESFVVTFEIGLPRREPFQFVVDTFGVPEGATAAADDALPFAVVVDTLVPESEAAVGQQTYLPLINR